MRNNKLDELRGLVQIFLLGNEVVCAGSVCRMLLFARRGRQSEDGGEGDRSDVEREQPDREELRHVDVELEVVFVEC